jgi:exodeoxyribonuclease V alpha subunit
LLKVAFATADGVRWFLPSRLPALETVFAMTVHKSQGSEFRHAVLIVPEQVSPVLTRELLYTGITRAAAQFSLVASDLRVMYRAIQQPTERRGGLRL